MGDGSRGRFATPPIPLYKTVARTRMYTYAAKVWELSIVQGAFSIAPCQTLALRFRNVFIGVEFNTFTH